MDTDSATKDTKTCVPESSDADDDDKAQQVVNPASVATKEFTHEVPITINIKSCWDEVTEGSPECNDSSKIVVEELRREVIESGQRRQNELFEIELLQMKEKHKLQMELWELKKQLLMKDLNNSI